MVDFNERAEMIQTALRACKTSAEVKDISAKYRAEVLDMHKHKETKVHAIHILNLKAYILDGFRKERKRRFD